MLQDEAGTDVGSKLPTVYEVGNDALDEVG